MTMLGMAALSGLLVAAALAGCSSGTAGTGKQPDQIEKSDPAPSGAD
jgi:hypothetical protein